MGGFAGRSVAVTGAGGFIGRAVCRRLAAEGAEVVGIDLDPATASRIREAGARPVFADVADPAAVATAFEGLELAVHAAAYVREWGSMEEFVRVNVGGTVNVLDAAAAAGIRRVAHISSVVIYGYHDRSEQPESAFRRVYGNPYIDTKSASDRVACRRGAVVIRPGDVYGPGSVPWVVRPFELARSGGLAVPGGGTMLPLYVDDLAEAVLLALDRGEPGRAYAVWDDRRPVEFAEHFDRLARMAGRRGARRLPRWLLIGLAACAERWAALRGRSPTLSAQGIVFLERRGTASVTAGREGLGWEPRVSYEEGMRRTERWLRTEGLI